MRVEQTLRPGQRGTRRFVERFGDRLVCVRYRYDEDRQRRVTTVELVMDEGAWRPRPDTPVGVRVVWGEADLARRVKAAGGAWDARRKLWTLRAEAVRRLGLERRMVRLVPPPEARLSLDSVTGHSM